MYSPYLLASYPIHPYSSGRFPPDRPHRLILNTNHSLASGLIGAWPVPFWGFGDKFGGKNNPSSGGSVILQGTEFGGVPKGDGGTLQSFVTSNTDFDATTGTWALWFRENVHNGTVRAVLMGRADPGTTPGGLILYINFTDSALKATFTYDISNALNISGGTVVTGQWHHAACVFRGPSATAEIYLDGVQVATGTVPASWGFPSGFNLGIGYSNGPVLTTTNGLDGNFCLSHWWGRALSAGEICSLASQPWAMYIPVGDTRTFAGSLTPSGITQGFALGGGTGAETEIEVRQGFALGASSTAFTVEDQYGSTSQGIRFASKMKSASGDLANGRYRR
jgi:hypothetical protein